MSDYFACAVYILLISFELIGDKDEKLCFQTLLLQYHKKHVITTALLLLFCIFLKCHSLIIEENSLLFLNYVHISIKNKVK